LPLAGVILRQRFVDELGLRTGQVEHLLGQLLDRELVRIAEVDRAWEIAPGVHHAQEAFDEIIDIAERAALLPIAVDRDRLTLQRLDDEVRHHTPVIGVHPGAIGVEDPHDLDVELVLPVVVEEQRLGAALALVVAGARTDRIDVTPIALRLWVNARIAVYLGSRRLEDPRLHALGETEHVDRARHARLGRLDRIELVMHGAGGTGEIVDLVDLDIEREADVVAHEFEARVVVQMVDIALVAGEEVIDAEDFIAPFEKPVDQVRAKEAGASCHEDALAAVISLLHSLALLRSSIERRRSLRKTVNRPRGNDDLFFSHVRTEISCTYTFSKASLIRAMSCSRVVALLLKSTAQIPSGLCTDPRYMLAHVGGLAKPTRYAKRCQILAGQA